jgi:hypothetical protein
MPMELLFLAVLFLPTFAAIMAWVLKHTSTTYGADTAPVNYWGSYQDSSAPITYNRIRLPEMPHEEIESASHIHTIGVHP